MKPLTIREASIKYGIPYETLRKEVKEGNRLYITKVGERSNIDENIENVAILDELSRRAGNRSIAQKHKWHERTVDIGFNTLFSTSEQIKIIDNLDKRHLLDLKFWYYGPGAILWDEFYQSSPVTQFVLDVFRKTAPVIQDELKGKKVNIIDVGCGNGDPAIKFIQYNNLEHMINTYVAVDISNELVELTRTRFNEAYPHIEVESYVHDIEREAFDEAILIQSYIDPDSVNVILFVGNTISNQDDREMALKNIRSSMSEQDLLLITLPSNDEVNIVHNNYIDFDDIEQSEWILKMIGIDVAETHYTHSYDERSQVQSMEMVIDKDYKINFNLNLKGRQQVITILIPKGRRINVWQRSLVDRETFELELEKSNYKVFNYLQSRDNKNMLFICRGV